MGKRGRYALEGKIQTPITDAQFVEGMRKGHFVQIKHRGFASLLYYSAVRVSEALRSLKEQYNVTDEAVYFDVGKRLKRGKITPALKIPLSLPYAREIAYAVNDAKKGGRVFPYCRRTGYNIVHRVFKYPHLFRLSRITEFFRMGWSIAEVRSWTGLSLVALEFYVAMVDIEKMGDRLGKEKI